jgi:hypothetical protein
MGWASKRNGELLALAAGEFDIFLTADRNLSYQQDLSAFDIAVVVLVARSNNINDLRPLVPSILNVLNGTGRGTVGGWWLVVGVGWLVVGGWLVGGARDFSTHH